MCQIERAKKVDLWGEGRGGQHKRALIVERRVEGMKPRGKLAQKIWHGMKGHKERP